MDSMPTLVAGQQPSQTMDCELSQSAGGTIRQCQVPVELREPFAIHTARMAIKSDGRILFINLSEVIAIQAQGNYVLLQCESGPFRLRESISQLAARLKHFGFVRIHRSTLVNRSWVEEIRTCVDGEYLLRLRSGREFSITRTYKRNLEALAELWLRNEDVS
jgi:DNA-binding LytR/AlgR family response regulator